MSNDATLIMTRLTGSLYDNSSIDRGILLNLELKRQERRRSLRYRTSAVEATAAPEVEKQHKVREVKQKSVDDYAKDLEQWLKKMKCTGVTGVRLDSFADIKVGINNDDPVDPSSPSLEPYPNLWQEKFKIKGYKDHLGRLKGKAILEFENGDSITGSFHEGRRHGECRIETSRNNVISIVGNYVNDQLQGRAKIHFTDGSSIEGFFCRGVLHGFARKFDEKGRLTFIGCHKNGIPHGVCWKIIRGGGAVVGRVNLKGCLTGMRIAYLYPDFKTAFVGSFDDGFLESAQVAQLKTVVDDRGVKIPVFTQPNGPYYKREISSFDFVTSEPLLPDPYESAMISVKTSDIEGAHEGIFANMPLEPNTIVAFYNGVRLTSVKAIDMPDWEDNAYRIFDPTRKDGTIDIPKEFISLTNYCASLAHKTNHSFMPNAEFVVFDHPRFGLVPSILTTQDIDADEEIFCHYGYEMDDCPTWYEAAWLAGNYEPPKKFKEWYLCDEKKGIPTYNVSGR